MAFPGYSANPPAEEDLTRHNVYAGDPSNHDSTYVGDREDLEPLFLKQVGSERAILARSAPKRRVPMG